MSFVSRRTEKQQIKLRPQGYNCDRHYGYRTAGAINCEISEKNAATNSIAAIKYLYSYSVIAIHHLCVYKETQNILKTQNILHNYRKIIVNLLKKPQNHRPNDKQQTKQYKRVLKKYYFLLRQSIDSRTPQQEQRPSLSCGLCDGPRRQRQQVQQHRHRYS